MLNMFLFLRMHSFFNLYASLFTYKTTNQLTQGSLEKSNFMQGSAAKKQSTQNEREHKNQRIERFTACNTFCV